MSINISVHGSPLAVRKQYGVKKTFDDFSKSHEFEKRRLMRLQQVREQSKSNSISLRKKVDSEKCRLLSDIEKRGADDLNRWRTQKLINLQKEFDECCEEIGSDKAETAVKLVKECRTQEDKENDRIKAQERGRLAEKRIREQKSNMQKKIQEENERKKLVRNLENLRSSLVTNLRNKRVQQPIPVKSSTLLPKSTVKNVPKRPLKSKRRPLTVKKAIKNTTTEESVEECTHVRCEHESETASGLLRAYTELLQKNLDPERFRISDDELNDDMMNLNYNEHNSLSDNESTHQPRKTPNTSLSTTHHMVIDRALSPIQVINKQSEQSQTSPAHNCIYMRSRGNDCNLVIDEQCQTTLIDDCGCKRQETKYNQGNDKIETNNQCICKRVDKKLETIGNCVCKRMKERGEKALNRVQATKHYNRIVEEMPVLQRVQQRNKNVINLRSIQPKIKKPVLHMGPERRREYEQMRQKRMEQIFEHKVPNENKPPIVVSKKSTDNDLVNLIERVNQQKKQLLDDILNLPAESNLENVLEDLSNLVKESDQNSGSKEERGKVPSIKQSIRKKIKYKSIAAQTSFSSRSSSTLSIERAVEISQKVEKSVQIPSADFGRYVDQSAQVSSDFEKGLKHETMGCQKVFKVGDVINVCEILVRVREDPQTYIEIDSEKRPRKIVRKKVYRHVSSVISSETSTSYMSPEVVPKKNGTKINPKLAQYIKKLLKMPKSKIDQLSCSDIGSRTPSILSLNDEELLNTNKVAETDDVTLSCDEGYKELAENCSKRIDNLIKQIEQIRQEKSQLFLSSSSTSASTGDSKEFSTQYLDPPVYTQPQVEKSLLIQSINNGQNKKPPKPPASIRNGKHMNLVVEPHELSAIAEVDSVLHKTLPTVQDESSIRSESIEMVFNSLGLNWAIPKLKEIRKISSDDKSTSDEQLNSFDKLVEKILQSLSTSSTITPMTTSSDTSNTLMLDSGRSSSINEMPERQRTSTPVPRVDDVSEVDYRTYFDDISSIKTSSHSNEINK